MNFTLKIWRQKDAKSKGAFETYKVENISADTSFLEMLDILNNNLIHEGKEPVAFDHDCREGICGMCSLHIDGQAHGPRKNVLLFVFCPTYKILDVGLFAIHEDADSIYLRAQPYHEKNRDKQQYRRKRDLPSGNAEGHS